MIDLNILKQKSKNDSLDYIYKEIGDFILKEGITIEKKYKDIDTLILEFIENDTFNFNIYVGLLTATYRFKHRLKNRKFLWEKTIQKAELENKLTDELVKITLNNLE